MWGTERETKVIRQRVVRKPRKKTKRVAIRDFFGEVIGYRTVKIRGKKKAEKKIVKQKKKASRSRKKGRIR